MNLWTYANAVEAFSRISFKITLSVVAINEIIISIKIEHYSAEKIRRKIIVVIQTTLNLHGFASIGSVL